MAKKATTKVAKTTKAAKVEAPVVEEVKVVETPVVEEVKAVEVPVVEEVKAEVKEEKKETAKKAPAKKAATTKKATTTKKAATKAETVITLEFGDYTAVMANVEEKVKAQFVADGNKATAIKTLNIYLKPFENSAYYVINDDVTGRVDLF